MTAFVADAYMQYRSVIAAAIVAASLALAMMFMAWSGFSFVFNSRQLTVVSAALVLGVILAYAMHVVFEKYEPQLQTHSA